MLFDEMKAKATAGWRERYAMRYGKRHYITISGRRCIRYTLSPKAKHQNANGATFDIVAGVWVN